MRSRMIVFWMLVLCYALAPMAVAETADELWKQVLSLDAGPGEALQEQGKAAEAILSHLRKQEQALRKFLESAPEDQRAFEAGMRLARMLQIQSDLTGSPGSLGEAERIFEELDRKAVGAQKVEVEFAKLAMQMRLYRPGDAERREALLGAVKQFAKRHPEDRRLAALLVEMAGLYPEQPKTMRGLLGEAQQLARGDEMRARIADDFRRLDLLGKPLGLELTGLNGKRFQVENLRGRVVVLFFFGLFAPYTSEAVETLKKAAAEVPELVVVGVSLDARPEPVEAMLAGAGVHWRVGFDGMGWEGRAVRSLGVNSAPSAWMLDPKGRLRSISALNEPAKMARQLLREL